MARVVAVHGEEELTQFWESKPTSLKKMSKRRQSGDDAPRDGRAKLPHYETAFQAKDGGEPLATFLEAARRGGRVGNVAFAVSLGPGFATYFERTA